ncbi:unnamed protein product [Dibothriocephalus latus]|uniref:Rapsyn myristoylation/linker region N-terminal domain-containing protein n=1 Tax=Dibothriocephalus latus TaxID=60516 RepID=A0A3P7PC12_DIBLA|nr:unnamed protein product [Dibothriocephalus latus]
MEAANMYEKEDNKYHAHMAYHNAVDCFLKIDHPMTTEALKKADLLKDNLGNDKKQAQVYKRYFNDLDKASEHYQLASLYEERSGTKHWSERALIKAARCAATGGNSQRAAKMFEKLSGIVAGLLLISPSDSWSINARRKLSCCLCNVSLFKQHRIWSNPAGGKSNLFRPTRLSPRSQHFVLQKRWL